MKRKGLSSIESPFCMALKHNGAYFLFFEMIGSKMNDSFNCINANK